MMCQVAGTMQIAMMQRPKSSWAQTDKSSPQTKKRLLDQGLKELDFWILPQVPKSMYSSFLSSVTTFAYSPHNILRLPIISNKIQMVGKQLSKCMIQAQRLYSVQKELCVYLCLSGLLLLLCICLSGCLSNAHANISRSQRTTLDAIPQNLRCHFPLFLFKHRVSHWHQRHKVGQAS